MRCISNMIAKTVERAELVNRRQMHGLDDPPSKMNMTSSESLGKYKIWLKVAMINLTLM